MKRFLIVIVALVALACLLLGWSTFGDRSSFRTGLDRHEGVPSTASDIAVYQCKNLNATFVADFRIAERDFVAFAAEKGWVLEPITSTVSIFQAEAFRKRPPKGVSDGLSYSKREDNGGGVAAGYDRKTGRGYINRFSH